ncbi:conjugative transposon protein TraM [Flagellimonas profundi]|uniref:Conjugative transposon protein TraM n=1 Tax=Flagellimonas profundi TaxID=2915620 RepID=A0ABS3FF06_9FLAO|nr:conjugative transposon protein TraM [Allomuricauda profundi]MBO0341497.1 conjugative transposon protein TraM [Allomuricauda profundi]|tara:strand:+ start:852 stop:1769 length:918 start_codon:yes stop_codon:yes gene_type:complete
MKAQKNKIVFVLVMVCVVLFLTIYGIMTFGKDKEPELDPERIPIPDLEEKQVEYDSKLRALEALKEERELTAPPIYPDHMIDDKGYFNPDYMEYEKQRVIDSVYASSAFSTNREESPEPMEVIERKTSHDDILEALEPEPVSAPTAADLSLSHQLFYASSPLDPALDHLEIKAYVDGDQTLRDGQRLDLRLSESVDLDGIKVPRGTRLFGFVKIRPNRVLVELTISGELPLKLKAHDAQDGREGIYVRNRLKGEVLDRTLDEGLDEINVPGLPRLNGIKRIFQRDHRAVKVKITDHYQFLLKSRS